MTKDLNDDKTAAASSVVCSLETGSMMRISAKSR